MSQNVADIRPWFKEDLIRLIAAIYLASMAPGASEEYREGFIAALKALALAVGGTNIKLE